MRVQTQNNIKAASEEMDLKMAEINGLMRNNEEKWQKSPNTTDRWK